MRVQRAVLKVVPAPAFLLDVRMKFCRSAGEGGAEGAASAWATRVAAGEEPGRARLPPAAPLAVWLGFAAFAAADDGEAVEPEALVVLPEELPPRS